MSSCSELWFDSRKPILSCRVGFSYSLPAIVVQIGLSSDSRPMGKQSCFLKILNYFWTFLTILQS